MVLLDIFRNYLNTLTGHNQEFEQLLAARDISAVKSKMQTNGDKIIEALKEYDTFSHDIMKREDKIITSKDGKYRGKEKVWKLPIPYPVYINEISLVFLFGQPVKWSQTSENTDRAFDAFMNVLKRTRFDAKIRQAKRTAGSETESAMLFRVFRDDDGQPDVQIRVLSKKKGDEIYIRKDNYENILSIAWGYYARESKDEVIYHFDIFTKTVIYRCAKKSLGWEVIEEPNFIGKIPIILFQQEKEWAGVEHLIYREEYIASRTADTNDYFSDPVAVMNADIIKNMPDKKEAGKLLIANGKDGIENAAKYLTWDSAPESKRQEIEWLQNQILSKSFTPNISLDTLKSLSNLSGKALRTVMLLADIKAAKHKETYDEMLDRTANLIKAIIGNVLDVSLKAECEKLEVSHSWQEPFGDDIESALTNIVKCIDAGILSTDTALELNPLVKDSQSEKERLLAEQEEARKRQEAIFGDTSGAGPQSASDGDDEDEDDEKNKKNDDDKSKK